MIRLALIFFLSGFLEIADSLKANLVHGATKNRVKLARSSVLKPSDDLDESDEDDEGALTEKADEQDEGKNNDLSTEDSFADEKQPEPDEEDQGADSKKTDDEQAFVEKSSDEDGKGNHVGDDAEQGPDEDEPGDDGDLRMKGRITI